MNGTIHMVGFWYGLVVFLFTCAYCAAGSTPIAQHLSFAISISMVCGFIACDFRVVRLCIMSAINAAQRNAAVPANRLNRSIVYKGAKLNFLKDET